VYSNTGPTRWPTCRRRTSGFSSLI
jgi:hypothetical protein